MCQSHGVVTRTRAPRQHQRGMAGGHLVWPPSSRRHRRRLGPLRITRKHSHQVRMRCASGADQVWNSFQLAYEFPVGPIDTPLFLRLHDLLDELLVLADRDWGIDSREQRLPGQLDNIHLRASCGSVSITECISMLILLSHTLWCFRSGPDRTNALLSPPSPPSAAADFPPASPLGSADGLGFPFPPLRLLVQQITNAVVGDKCGNYGTGMA